MTIDPSSNGLTTGRHAALGMHHTAGGGSGGLVCHNQRTIDQLVTDLESARTDIITIDVRTAKTHALVQELHARNHDEDIAERTLSDVEQREKAERKDRAERFKLALEVLKTIAAIAPWVGLAWALLRH
jgi:biopolymer transport protein ExbB/TolQ